MYPDILIFGGQSNMQGQSEATRADNTPVSGAWEYRVTGDLLKPLCDPVGEELGDSYLLGAHNGCANLLVPFCRAYIQKHGTPVVAIHAARGATTVAEWLHGTQRYDCAKKKILAGIKKAKDAFGGVGRILYIWLQGESDAIIETSTEEYLRHLIDYKNSLKADIGIEKFGIIRVGYFVAVTPWWDTPEEKRAALDEAIMLAQDTAAAIDNDFVMLTRVLSEFSRDPECIAPGVPGHYSVGAFDRLGVLAAENL